MAICSALTGAISKSCDTNTGGVRKILIGDYEHVSRSTVTLTSGVITDLKKLVISNGLTVDTIGQVLTASGDWTNNLKVGDTIIYEYEISTGVFGKQKGEILTIVFASSTTTITLTDTIPTALPTSLTDLWLAPTFYEFSFNRNTSSFEESVNVNLENGSTFFAQIVSLELARRESTKRDAIEKLVAGQKQLAAIVLDSNGIYWAFGFDEGLYATEIIGGSGVAKSDKNGYSIKLTAEESYQAHEVDSTNISEYLINA